MTLSGRPLLRAADLELFVGRDPQRLRAVAGLRSGLNCLLVGDPGSGRTTLARAILASLEPGEIVEITVRAARDAGPADLLAALSAELGLSGFDDPGPARLSGRDEALDLVDRIRRQVAAAALPAATTMVFLLEDIQGEAGLQLFGSLRDELWTIDARWLVAVSTAQAPALIRPPADVFFEVQITLPPLDDADSRQLVLRRVPDADPGVVARVVSAAAGNPRRLIDLARQLLENPDSATEVTDALRRRDAALARLSRPAQLLASELEALGGASASDPQLLDRMAWTRARAVQVLSELEDSGLVTYRTESTGRGRPRKVYRLIPPEEFNPPYGGVGGTGG